MNQLEFTGWMKADKGQIEGSLIRSSWSKLKRSLKRRSIGGVIVVVVIIISAASSSSAFFQPWEPGARSQDQQDEQNEEAWKVRKEHCRQTDAQSFAENNQAKPPTIRPAHGGCCLQQDSTCAILLGSHPALKLAYMRFMCFTSLLPFTLYYSLFSASRFQPESMHKECDHLQAFFLWISGPWRSFPCTCCTKTNLNCTTPRSSGSISFHSSMNLRV